MALSVLPDHINMTDYTSNLSGGFSESNQVVLLDDGNDGVEGIEDFRLDWGQDVAITLALGSYGLMKGGMKGAALWGLAAFFLPLPTAVYAFVKEYDVTRKP